MASPQGSALVRFVRLLGTDLKIVGHPIRPYLAVEFLWRQLVCLYLGDAPRFEVVLLMEAHWLSLELRVGSLDPKIGRTIRAADADRTEMVYLAALALT